MANPALSVSVDGLGGSGSLSFDYTLSTDVWYFFAVVFDADANWVDLYINGEWVAGQDVGPDFPDVGTLVVGDPKDNPQSVTFPTLSTDDHMLTATSTLGAFNVTQALPETGTMVLSFDEVGVSTTTLYSPADIKALYDVGSGMSWPPNDNYTLPQAQQMFFDPWPNVRCVQGVTPNAAPVVGYNGLVPGPAT